MILWAEEAVDPFKNHVLRCLKQIGENGLSAFVHKGKYFVKQQSDFHKKITAF